MERRKDTPGTGTKLPREYLDMVSEIFNKNFSKQLKQAIPTKTTSKKSAQKSGKETPKESFVVFGEAYPDEIILVLSLKSPDDDLRMTTCYASIDYPPKGATKASSVSEAVQSCVSSCVDATASFFATYFEDGRPVDYDLEYRQNWTPIEIAKNAPTVYLRINHDNLELESQADALLEEAEAMANKPKKDKLH